MEFCIITPIAGLTHYARLSKTHLLLPQVQDPRYRNFYRRCRDLNDTLILDNGAYEGRSDWKLTEDMIQFYNPQVCVLPDYLLEDWRKTFRAALHYLDLWYEKYPQTEWMFVPQACVGDVLGFAECLNQILDRERERVTWIGLPRKLPTHICNDPMMRVNMCKWVKQRTHRKVHALGMVNGSIVEMKMLEQARCNSIDSSAPVWRGWCRKSMMEEWPGTPEDFNADFPSAEGVGKILENLNECGVGTTDNDREKARAGFENYEL